DDGNADVFPGAIETCNEVDDDCDGQVDNNALDASTWYRDEDGDTFGNEEVTAIACDQPEGYVADAGDCADLDAGVNPDALEECDGLEDENCNGEVDEDSAFDVATWYADTDNDGHGDASQTDLDCDQPEGYVSEGDDCDDGNVDSYPGNAEHCDDVDNDCNGLVDDGTGDADGDGYEAEDCGGDDCDDNVATINPGVTDVCGNGIDDDCDGDIDEDLNTYYYDEDGDGCGNWAISTEDCAAPASYVANDSDCNDHNSDLCEIC
ncbi:MAG: putative metal-binding motif-containing protein, partial [Patescibacteria group bacterium]